MEWSYIAGFFDGEGSVAHNGNGFRIQITQTHYDVLERIRSFSGVGYVFTITKRKQHWKDSWIYNVAKQRDVYIFLKNVEKYVIVKRELVRRALVHLERYLSEVQARQARLEQRIAMGTRFREQGHTYRFIGQKLHVDHGYIRRLILKNS